MDSSVCINEVSDLDAPFRVGSGVLVSDTDRVIWARGDQSRVGSGIHRKSVNTYEGTYDIHGLILGREITGIQAFVPLGNPGDGEA